MSCIIPRNRTRVLGFTDLIVAGVRNGTYEHQQHEIQSKIDSIIINFTWINAENGEYYSR